MVTARAQQEEIVKGLKNGADDYITKPFNEKELLSRIETISRRETTKTYLETDVVILDMNVFKLTYINNLIRLTQRECILLVLFIQNLNHVFSLEHLIDLLWGFDSDTEG